MKSLFSDNQVEQLTTFVETRSGKSGLLRYAGQLYSKQVVTTNQGFPPPYTGFQGAHTSDRQSEDKSLDRRRTSSKRRNLAQIDRSYWLSGNPLPVTEQNLNRGKEVFLAAVRRLPRSQGDGKGPGRRSSRRRPPTSPTRTTPAAAATPGRATSTTASCAAGRAPAMENFGDRLVDDIWRVVMFVKTIPNHTLGEELVPEPKDYIAWQPSKELLAWLKSRQKLRRTRRSTRRRSRTRSCRKRCASSRACPGESFLINDGKTPLSLRTQPPGSGRSTTICWTRLGRGPAPAATSCRRCRRRPFRRPCRGSNEAPA